MAHDATSKILCLLPGMSRARVVGRLADGPTNASYLAERDGERFVVRLDKAEAVALGLNRENERTVSAAIAAAGLAPDYLHFDVAAGVSLRPFIDGRTLRRDDLLDPATLARLATVLRRLHRLPPVGTRFDPAAAARRYAAQLGTLRASELARRVEDAVAATQRHPAQPALCHNDLVAENMLGTAEQGILLIDWEYAAVGDPLFDLAVVARHHDLGERLSLDFLTAYLQVSATEAEAQRFALQCSLYDALLELWNLRVAPDRSQGIAGGDLKTAYRP